MGLCNWEGECYHRAPRPAAGGGHATSLQSPGDSLQHGAALYRPRGKVYGPITYLAKFHLTPFLQNYNAPFFSSFFHKKLKPFSVLQLSLHKPGGFSLGSEKLIQRFPLSHISTARPLSRAELGSERIVKEMGRFQCPTSAELSWNSPIKLLLPWGVGAGLWRAWRRSASHWDCTLLILQQLLPPASPWLSHPRHKVMRSWLEGALQR